MGLFQKNQYVWLLYSLRTTLINMLLCCTKQCKLSIVRHWLYSHSVFQVGIHGDSASIDISLSLSLFHEHNLYNPLSLPLTLALTGAGPLVIELTYLASLLLPSSMLLPWWCTHFIMCHVNLVILALEHKTFWIDLKTIQRIY